MATVAYCKLLIYRGKSRKKMFFAGNGTTYGHGVTYNNVSVGIKGAMLCL
jgi:hypothetical protein